MVGAQVCMDETQGGDCGYACQAQVVRVLPMCMGHEQADFGEGRFYIKEFLRGLQQKCGRSPTPMWSPTPNGGWSPTPSWSPSMGGWSPTPNWSPSGGMSDCETQFLVGAQFCQDDDCNQDCQGQVARVLPMCMGHEQADLGEGRFSIKQFLQGLQQKCGRSPTPMWSPTPNGGWSPTPSWSSPSGGGWSPTPNWSPSGGMSQCETQFMVGAQVCMDETQGGDCGYACQAQVMRVLPMCMGHEQADFGEGRFYIKEFLRGLQQKCGGSSPGRSPSGGDGGWSPTPSWSSPSMGGWSPTPNWSPSGGMPSCENEFMVGAQVCMDETQGGDCGYACQAQVVRVLPMCMGHE